MTGRFGCQAVSLHTTIVREHYTCQIIIVVLYIGKHIALCIEKLYGVTHLVC